jgi:CHASE2 domain-containing sensor protein
MKLTWRPERKPISAAKAYGIALLFFAAFYVLEHAAEIGEQMGIEVNHNWVDAQSAYQRLLYLGPRPLSSNYVTLVFLNSKELPFLNSSACDLRRFIARLLPKLVDAHPAVIVFDYAFVANKCPATDPGSQALVSAVSESNPEMPLVLGLGTLTRAEAQSTEDSSHEISDRDRFGAGDLILQTPFLEKDTPSLSWGLIRLNRDLQRIPITWSVRRSSSTDPTAYSAESLAFAAAKAYRSPFPKAAVKLEELKLMRAHPQTTFLQMDAIPSVSAFSALCGAPAVGGEDWRTCSKPENSQTPELQEMRAKIRDRVLVVGWRDDVNDQHLTQIGLLPGPVVQANYIEALLDWRYLTPAALWLQLVVGLSWLIIFEMIFWQESFATWKAAIYAVVLCAILGILIYYVAAINFGTYFSLWPPGIVALFIRIGQRTIDAAKKKKVTGMPSAVGRV